MRITESVLRGLIRETLLREAPGPAGELPGVPGKNVKNKTVLKQLQAIIGATETGVYDDETENKWDDFIDANEDAITTLLVGATIEQVKTDWASAAKNIKVSKLTFTPDIQGMLKFAEIFVPDNTETAASIGSDVGADQAATGLPYRLTLDEPDVWPAGLTLDSGVAWKAWTEDENAPTDSISSQNMFHRYGELENVINNGRKVWLVGFTTPIIEKQTKVFAYSITDVDTLDSIFVFSSGDKEETDKYSTVQLAGATAKTDKKTGKIVLTSHPYKLNAADPDEWPNPNLNVKTLNASDDNGPLPSWWVDIDDEEQTYTSPQMISNYEYFADVIKANIEDSASNPILYLLGIDSEYDANLEAGKVHYYPITDIATLDKIIRPGP